MTKPSGWKQVLLLIPLCAAMAVAAHAQTFNVLASFDGTNGAYPELSLVQGTDGNLYGTTSAGSWDGGTVFKITRHGELTTLHSFCADGGICGDGYSPGQLVLATNGDFYDTTNVGGGSVTPRIRYGSGTFFQITPTGMFRTLRGSCSCFSPLIQGTDDNFYGSTGASIFRMTLAGTVTTLHSPIPLSSIPGGGLVEANDGNFYGIGGGNNLCFGGPCGGISKVTPFGESMTLYNFCSQPGCTDGAAPNPPLILARDGNLYGTTSDLLVSPGVGTVFRVTLNGTLTTLHKFCTATIRQIGCADGSEPFAPLVEATDGNFYGTTAFGGDHNKGVVFKITPQGALTTVYSFCSQSNCDDGADPEGGLLQATDGKLYGTTTVSAGTAGFGEVFSLDVGLGPFVAFVHNSGKVGQTGGILGQGLTGTTNVLLNGTPANFTVVSDTFIEATVPAGATSGYVTVTTPSGVLTSNVMFRVLP
jgi:uncharacterized repeat protein (TIGR03803 family)